MATLDGSDPNFHLRVQAMIDASHGALYLTSGFRTEQEQKDLYAGAVQRYGEIGAGKWVAAPGHSNHEKGIAADIGGDMGALKELAPRFGLYTPMSWEPWHVEPISTANHGADPQAYTDSPHGDPNPVVQDHSNDSGYWAATFAASLDTPQGVGNSNGILGNVDFSQGAQPDGKGGGGNGTAGGGGGGGGGGATGSGGGAFGGVDPAKWSTDFLTALGKPVTPENIKAIEAWQRAESGGGGGKFNPLNTTQGGFAGETNLNGVGVKNYSSYEDGIAANVKVINNGRYQPILSALDRGNDAMAVAHAVAATPWGTGSGVVRALS